MKVDLSVNIAGIKLKNPVLVSSGTFGYGDEIGDLLDLKKLGGIITKTITLKPRDGNPSPRICETASGILNSIGLQNIGLDKFINNKAKDILKIGVPVIVSIAGESARGYGEVAERLNAELDGIAGIELNLSCPNLSKDIIAQDSMSVKEVITEVKRVFKKPVIAKLSPQVSSISFIARAAKEAGADALSLVNTFPGMAIDIESWKPKLANVTGGLSGPAIKPMALRAVWEVHKNVDIPIIGGGGIADYKDAAEFLLAGADAISVGTATFINPTCAVSVIDGLEKYMEERNIYSLGQIKGKLIKGS